MLRKTGEIGVITKKYLFVLGSYRAFYLLNWIYRYYSERYFDPISVCAGIVQNCLFLCLVIYILFFIKPKSELIDKQDEIKVNLISIKV